MSVAGSYDCVTKTPMGDQSGVFTVVPGDDGNTFTGNISGELGSMDVKDGIIDGNTLRWKMDMTVPMAIKLDCEATVEGDELSGTVKAGMFGTMKISGQRR